MRRALITGISGGIGSAVGDVLAQRGYAIAGAYYTGRSAGAEALLQRIGQPKERALCADLKKCGEAQRLASLAQHRLGGIDTLVYAAGTAERCVFDDIDEGMFDAMMALHVRALFSLSRALAADMRQEGFGRIIVISSMWGQVGASMEVGYSAAKAAQIGFVRALAKELGPSGITVNAVCPGLIDTPMNAGLDVDALIDNTPLGRMGTAQDVAHAVAYLASEEAGFVTGQLLPVNGGYVI